MSIDMLNGKIRVYNFDRSPVCFPSQHVQQGIIIRGRDEDEEFVVERIAFDDIEIENSKSSLFKVGRLRFHPDEEDEVYQKLSIEDRENIMNDKQLHNFLLTDTVENVKKISSIKSATFISRLKSALFAMERVGKIPPVRISSAVIERSHEIINGGIRNPNGGIQQVLDLEKQAKEEANLKDTLYELTRKVETLEKEKESKDEIIAKSQSAMELLLKKVEELTTQQSTTQPSNQGAPKQTKTQNGGRPKRT